MPRIFWSWVQIQRLLAIAASSAVLTGAVGAQDVAAPDAGADGQDPVSETADAAPPSVDPPVAFRIASPGQMAGAEAGTFQHVELDLFGCRIRQTLLGVGARDAAIPAALQVLSIDLRDVAPGGVVALATPDDSAVVVTFLLTDDARAAMEAARNAREEAVLGLTEPSDIAAAHARFFAEVTAGDHGASVRRSHVFQSVSTDGWRVFPHTQPPRIFADFDAAQPMLTAMFELHTGPCAPPSQPGPAAD